MTDKNEKAAPGLIGLDFLKAIEIRPVDEDGWRFLWAGGKCIGWIHDGEKGNCYMTIFTAKGQIATVTAQMK